MLVLFPASRRRVLPSWGWRCTGYWWCCWTSPVPPGDSSCETGDCCSRERKTTCYHSLSNVYHQAHVCLQLTSLQCQQGISPVYGHSKNKSLLYCLSSQIHSQWLIFLFSPFFHYNQVTLNPLEFNFHSRLMTLNYGFMSYKLTRAPSFVLIPSMPAI